MLFSWPNWPECHNLGRTGQSNILKAELAWVSFSQPKWQVWYHYRCWIGKNGASHFLSRSGKSVYSMSRIGKIAILWVEVASVPFSEQKWQECHSLSRSGKGDILWAEVARVPFSEPKFQECHSLSRCGKSVILSTRVPSMVALSLSKWQEWWQPFSQSKWQDCNFLTRSGNSAYSLSRSGKSAILWVEVASAPFS